MLENQQQPPAIELDRAHLRPLRTTDVDAHHEYLQDPLVTASTSYPVLSVALVEEMIERSLRRWASGQLSKWGIALKHDDRLIGTCGFNDWSPAHRWAELGFDLARPLWGGGLMREALPEVLQWGFRQGQLNRIHAFVRVDNARSEHLLKRVGFVREGCLRGFRVCRGEPHDFYVYGLMRSDWTNGLASTRLTRTNKRLVGDDSR